MEIRVEQEDIEKALFRYLREKYKIKSRFMGDAVEISCNHSRADKRTYFARVKLEEGEKVEEITNDKTS